MSIPSALRTSPKKNIFRPFLFVFLLLFPSFLFTNVLNFVGKSKEKQDSPSEPTNGNFLSFRGTQGVKEKPNFFERIEDQKVKDDPENGPLEWKSPEEGLEWFLNSQFKDLTADEKQNFKKSFFEIFENLGPEDSEKIAKLLEENEVFELLEGDGVEKILKKLQVDEKQINDSGESSSAFYRILNLILWGFLGIFSGKIGRKIQNGKKNEKQISGDDFLAPLPDGQSSLKRNFSDIFAKNSSRYPLLSQVEHPSALKTLSVAELEGLAREVREFLLEAVSKTGGHLGSNLGTVELSLALHKVFSSPHDKIIFDVGHQAYPHKILTGRKGRFFELRKGGGLSGFTNRSESEHDSFGAGHSSTAISAGVGMAVGRDLKEEVKGGKEGKEGKGASEEGNPQKEGTSAPSSPFVVPVVGDGAMTGGMAFEALNHAGFLKLKKFLVVLNDNEQVSLPTSYNSIDTPVGALSSSLKKKNLLSPEIAKVLSSPPFHSARKSLKSASKKLFHENVARGLGQMEEYARGMLAGDGKGTLFEELGFHYLGPVDGHDLPLLLQVLEGIKEAMEGGTLDKPVLLHVRTQKGKGYRPAEEAKDRLHGVQTFDIRTGKNGKGQGKEPAPTLKQPQKEKKLAFTDFFASSLVEAASKDPRILAITAAMPGGTGLHQFEKAFGQKRMLDVGICEQHAVTLAAGAACEGMRPWVAIYSTFLQRAYDQIIHDVALQNLPVRFALDRAGFVGPDGATHHGLFDLAFLSCVPNLKILAPSDGLELRKMIKFMSEVPEEEDGPMAIRYPRAETEEGGGGAVEGGEIRLGKARVLMEGRLEEGGEGLPSLCIVGLGPSALDSLKAAQNLLKQRKINRFTVVDARWAKPLDSEKFRGLSRSHDFFFTCEEGSSGGFGSSVAREVSKEGGVVRQICVPDRFFEQDTAEKQREKAGISAGEIEKTIRKALDGWKK